MKNFNITWSTWYIERFGRQNVDLLMKDFGQVSQNSFFPLGKNRSAGLLKLCSTSTEKHSEEIVFENTFFDLRILSWSVSVSVVKISNKLVKTAFQVFRRKLSLIFFLQKITVFHHHRKFKWIVSAFWRKNFTFNVKTAF